MISGSAPARPAGDTLHSTPPPKPKPAPNTDTVALVEKATAPRRVSASLALLIILAALSLVAGLTVYILRMRAGTPENPAPARASASRSS